MTRFEFVENWKYFFMFLVYIFVLEQFKSVEIILPLFLFGFRIALVSNRFLTRFSTIQFRKSWGGIKAATVLSATKARRDFVLVPKDLY